jgi:hypothetical protein
MALFCRSRYLALPFPTRTHTITNRQPSRYDYAAYEKFMDEGDFFKYLPPFWQWDIIHRWLKQLYPPDAGRYNHTLLFAFLVFSSGKRA